MTTREPKRLYKIVAGFIPPEHRFVLIRFADGATWLVRGTVANRLDAEHQYRHRHEAAMNEDDAEYAREVESRTLREWKVWCALNGDAVQAILETRWSDIKKLHIDGPATEVPDNDRVWWVDENGGKLDEVTDLPPSAQRRTKYLLWTDRRPGVKEDGRGRCDASCPLWVRPSGRKSVLA